MKRKIAAMLMASVMALSLCACGESGNGDAAQSGGNGSTEASEGDSSGAENSTSGEITKMIMAFPTWTGAPADTEKIQEAMNEITRDKLGIEIELQIMDVGSYNQNMTLALSGGEQIDILSTMGFAYANAVRQGYLKDLEENDLLSTYGSGIVEAVGEENIDACRVSGVLYGLPNNRDMAQGRGCAAIATEYLEGIGYDVSSDSEIIKISLDELNDIYAQLHEKYPDKEVYRPSAGSMSQFSNVDSLGGNVFGVLLDNGKELKVENLFTSDFYMDYCKRMYDYNQKGYISQDAATDTTGVSEIVKAGALMSYTTGGKPGIKAQETNLCGRDMTIFQTREDYVSSAAVASYPWAIPISTVNPEAAMVLLNELYTNPELADLIIYGIEGTHYGITEDGFLDQNLGTSSGNYGTLNWLYPNQFASTVIVGNTSDLWERTRTFNEEARKSPASGFAFDSTSIATEQTAVTNVYEEYRKSLEYGFVDPEVAIPEMVEKMNSAGLQKIIEEKQAQLDAWAASK